MEDSETTSLRAENIALRKQLELNASLEQMMKEFKGRLGEFDHLVQKKKEIINQVQTKDLDDLFDMCF